MILGSKGFQGLGRFKAFGLNTLADGQELGLEGLSSLSP